MFLRFFLFLLLPLLSVILVSCSGSGGSSTYNPDIGPFDEDGNYVEAWADNPPKRGSKRKTPAPKLATPSRPEPKPPVVVAARPVPKPVPVARTVNLPKPPPPAPVARVAPKVKPTPRPVVVKPKPRPKPAAPEPRRLTRHTVRKGDTLYSLSKRYGTSISAIKRANGISGSTIITGRSYVIPR